MPNGKMHKGPPKRLSNYKKAVKLEEGLVLARNRGVNKWKSSKKGIMRLIQDRLEKIIDRIDPLETVAVLGTTFIVKTMLLDRMEEVAKLYRGNVGGIPFGMGLIIESVRKEGVTILAIKNPFTGEVIWEWTIGEKLSESEPEALLGGVPDWYQWIIAFAIAYMIVKHGGELFGALKGIGPIVGAMVGIAKPL